MVATYVISPPSAHNHPNGWFVVCCCLTIVEQLLYGFGCADASFSPRTAGRRNGKMNLMTASSTHSAPASSRAPRRRVAVVGGGISGLAAAHRVTELDPAAELVLLEASDRLGGVLGTEARDGYLIERSADMFTTREPWALDLCRRIGIADELIGATPGNRQAYVVRRGRLEPVPDGFTLMAPAKVWPVVTTRLLSPWGKLRLARERFIPPRTDDADESLQSFVVRRMGQEVFDRLVQPLIGGIYTADPARLSLRATMPQFLEMERKYGSVTRGMLAQRAKAESGKPKAAESGARYSQFLAPRLGMQQLIDAIAAKLPAGCVRLNCAVERIERCAATESFTLSPGEGQGEGPSPAAAHRHQDPAWRIHLKNQSTPETFTDLIVATPAYASQPILRAIDGELASLVSSIPHAGCSVAVLGYRRDQIDHPLNLFGAVAPAIEQRQIIAVSLASVKFAGRAPEGKVLLRVFVGGALQPHLANLPDDQIQSLVRRELGELLGVRGEPEFCLIRRWLGTMPQYHVGHLDLVEQIEQRAASVPNFALAGNAYRGVGIPFCIRSGEQAAERIASSTGRQ